MQGFGANGELQYEREGEVATTLLSLLKSKSPHFCAAIAKQEFTYTPLPGEELTAMTDNKEAEQTVSYEVEFKEVSPGGKRAQVGQSSVEKKQGRYVRMCMCTYVCTTCRQVLVCTVGRTCGKSILHCNVHYACLTSEMKAYVRVCACVYTIQCTCCVHLCLCDSGLTGV